MEYKVAFDLSRDAPPDWPMLIGGLVFLIVGPFLIYASRNSARTSLKVFAWVWTFFPICIFATGFISESRYRASLINSLQQGRLPVIEGAVQDFQPIPTNGIGWEKFLVQGHKFAYFNDGPKNGFHTTRKQGGPIREGLPVRITCGPNSEIVRLEIPTNEPYSAPPAKPANLRLWLTPLGILLACLLWLWMHDRLWMPYQEKDLLFSQSMVSGHSLSNWLMRMGGARNVLLVALTPDTLFVDSIMPFRLFVPLEIWGHNHKVSIQRILRLEKKDHSRLLSWLGAQPELDVEYNDDSGNTKAFALYLTRRDELYDKLQNLRTKWSGSSPS